MNVMVPAEFLLSVEIAMAEDVLSAINAMALVAVGIVSHAMALVEQSACFVMEEGESTIWF